MVFRREEGFRYVVEDSVEITGTLVSTNKELHDKPWTGRILDISPRGLKIQTDLELLSSEILQVKFTVAFIINEEVLTGVADIRWSRKYANELQYGLYFDEQAELEEKVVEELKLWIRTKNAAKKVLA